MAHKGRTYDCWQLARHLAGNVNWPNYPAKRYLMKEGDGTFGIPPGVPWPLPLERDLSAPPGPQMQWLSEVVTLTGDDYQFGLVIWGSGLFILPSHIHQIWINGSPQYELIVDGFEPIGSWQHPTNLGTSMTPTPGATAGFLGIIQSDAVLW